MRNPWVKRASNRNRVDDVKRYFNTFATKHHGYTFIIAKKFNDLYDVCVTAQQCSEIKRHLEREFGLAGYLDEANSLEVPWIDCKERSFRNTQDFREYRGHTLSTMNRPVIRAKYAEARQHYDFDIEVYEHNHDIMLEIGYVTCQISPVTGDKPDVTLHGHYKRHLIIRENLHYKNGDRVPDNCYGFRFGSLMQ